ncbi:MAG: D-cysteine desulfhydrase family protein, partial [Anaerolineae bacterium]
GKAMTIHPEDVFVNADYLGGGYGVMGEAEREAITLFAQLEGVLLDPVYTGRAFGGLIELLRRPGAMARFGIPEPRTVIFWHTGGSPALFAYAPELLP